MDMNAVSDLLRLPGDEPHPRRLRLLAQESLDVYELTAILGVAQSDVSLSSTARTTATRGR